MNWCTPGYNGVGVPRGPHETDAETFLVISHDERSGTAGVTHICVDCIREGVIVGQIKHPSRMLSSYRDYATRDRAAALARYASLTPNQGDSPRSPSEVGGPARTPLTVESAASSSAGGRPESF